MFAALKSGTGEADLRAAIEKFAASRSADRAAAAPSPIFRSLPGHAR
jgi:hypothetical protein